MKTIESRWLVATIGLLLFAPIGCASGGNEQDVDNPEALSIEEADFLFWYREMITATDANPNYRRIPINSPSQQQRFNQLIEAAYFGQITADDFVRTATSWYPDYETSIRIIASYIPTPAEREQIQEDEKAVEGQG